MIGGGGGAIGYLTTKLGGGGYNGEEEENLLKCFCEDGKARCGSSEATAYFNPRCQVKTIYR